MTTKRYQRILVPLDGSKLAEQVLPHAVSLAATTRGEVVLMHVVPADGQLVHPPTPSQLAAMEAITGYLKRVKEIWTHKSKCEIGWRVSCGDPIKDLLTFIREGDVDMVAMCTHGKGQVQDGSKLGSIATELLQRVTIPFLLLKPEGEIAEQ